MNNATPTYFNFFKFENYLSLSTVWSGVAVITTTTLFESVEDMLMISSSDEMDEDDHEEHTPSNLMDVGDSI